MEIGVMDIY